MCSTFSANWLHQSHGPISKFNREQGHKLVICSEIKKGYISSHPLKSHSPSCSRNYCISVTAASLYQRRNIKIPRWNLLLYSLNKGRAVWTLAQIVISEAICVTLISDTSCLPSADQPLNNEVWIILTTNQTVCDLGITQFHWGRHLDLHSSI